MTAATNNTTYEWFTERERAIALFGDTPGAELESQILTYFREQPARVHTAIDSVGRKVATGQVHSGWPILARELAARSSNVRATDHAERSRALELAQTWIRNTGGYIDRESELGATLFGEQGSLQDWPELWHDIAALWRQERARFVATEAAALERQYVQAETYKRLRKNTRAQTREDADRQARLILAEVERARLAYLEQLAPDEDDTP